MAPHSLRAVTPAMLRRVAGLPGPIHIHAAEQLKEVAECLAATGARPVQWLLDNAPVDARWCLIHATHMDAGGDRGAGRDRRGRRALPHDRGLARRRHLPAAGLPGAGGRFGIGTDSHVGTSPRDELRQLETSQRLRAARTRRGDRRRPRRIPAALLLDAALAGGAQASGRPLGAIAPGLRCDLVELDADAPLAGRAAGDSAAGCLGVLRPGQSRPHRRRRRRSGWSRPGAMSRGWRSARPSPRTMRRLLA